MPRSGPPPSRGGFTSRRARRAEFAIKQPRIDLIKGRSSLGAVRDVEPPLVTEAWYRDAYAMVDAIGEVGYIVNLTANLVSKCLLIPEEYIDGQWVTSKEASVQRVDAALVGPRGGKAELLRKAALHMQISGDCQFVGTPIVDELNEPSGVAWEFLSPLEIKVDKNLIERTYAPTGGGKVKIIEGYVARFFRSAAAYSELADSPLRRVLPIMREIVLLTQVVDAIAKTRLNAGIFYVPWEMSFGPDQEAEDPGVAPTGIDEFEEELARHLMAPVEDRTSPASLVPLLMRGPAAIDGKSGKELMGLVELARGLDTLYSELRAEALGRLANGLDVPPEILLGKASLSHWTADNIDNALLEDHVEPVGQMTAEFLTSSYMRPMLVESEELTPDDAARFRYRFDMSTVKSEGTSAEIKDAFDRRVASEETYLRSLGLDKGDSASPNEIRYRLLIDVLMNNPSQLGPAILPLLLPNDPALEKALKKWPDAKDTASPLFGSSVEEPVELGDVPTPVNVQVAEQTLVERLATAADRELERALERAANRLISKLNGNPVEANRLRAKSRGEVLTEAGADLINEAGLTMDELLRDAWVQLEARGRSWVREHLEASGVDPFVAEEQAAICMHELANLLTLHAGSAVKRRLRVGPNGLKVPYELVRMSFDATRLVRT